MSIHLLTTAGVAAEGALVASVLLIGLLSKVSALVRRSAVEDLLGGGEGVASCVGSAGFYFSVGG